MEKNQTQTQNPYTCPVCGEKFSFNFVPSHVARVHLNKKVLKSDGKFHCPDCGFTHKSRRRVYRHIYEVHFRTIQDIKATTINNFTPQSVIQPEPEPEQEIEIVYNDWNNLLPTLQTAYKAGMFVLILGPKGTGKTTLVRKFAQMVGAKLYSINFSLRTKESHLVGTTTLRNGSTEFALGIIPQSMKEGGILYLDELNTAEPDVLIRLDEALDDRRELVLKEAEGVTRVKAHPKWFVIATINPLSHVGTKELPPQLLSRFPIRIVLDYPPEQVEREIIKMYSSANGEDLKKAVILANKLRDAAKVEDIFYSPSLRETIAFAKLLETGTNPREAAELVFANVYYQWGPQEVQKVKDLIVSLWGEKQ